LENVKAVLFGVGAVGGLIAKFLLQKPGLEVVGAIDVAEEKVGRDLGTILDLGRDLGITVTRDVASILSKTTPNVVVHATSSYLKDIYPQLTEIVEYGANIVSTCEELSYPYYSNPKLANDLDILARKHDITILGTGINPGFLMDTLVITLTAVCQEIETIRAMRVMDASVRRVPFQKKIGAGLSIEDFQRAISEKLITGHVGLEQSIAMIAAALKWNLEKIHIDKVEPVIARKPVASEAIKVKEGCAAGLRQKAYGIRESAKVISLDFQAFIGAEEEHDSVSIKGLPNVNQIISPCIHGDLSTVAMVVNSIPKVINAPPGLVTMKDLPVPSAAVGNIVNFVK
jgi:hypothetical protein